MAHQPVHKVQCFKLRPSVILGHGALIGERYEIAIFGCNSYAEAEALAIKCGEQVIRQPWSSGVGG